jgi:hypothetical protein
MNMKPISMTLPRRSFKALARRGSLAVVAGLALVLLASCANNNRPKPGGPTSNLDPKAWNTPQSWEGGAQFGMFPQSR